MTRVLTLVALLLATSCATNRTAAAVQQTAIGGGFVAVGVLATGAEAIIATGVAVAVDEAGDSQEQAIIDAAVVPLIGYGLFAAVTLATGIAMIKFAEDDLVEGVQAPQPAPPRMDAPRKVMKRPRRAPAAPQGPTWSEPDDESDTGPIRSAEPDDDG